METVERVAIEIPGVKVEGTFPIKTFLEVLYNSAAKKHGVKLTVKVMPPAQDERAAQTAKKGVNSA